MPLIILSGYPSSGKTTRAQQLLTYFSSRITSSSSSPASNPSNPPSSSNPHLTVTHISSTTLNIPRTAYSNVRAEKDARAAEMSAVKRALGKDTIVIADGLNYIKGYRYQLWCEAKAVGTRCCVVHVGTSVETCRQWNRRRREAAGAEKEDGLREQDADGGGSKRGDTGDDKGYYEEEVFEQLVYRYEEPNGMNRWDSPLFTVLEEDKDVSGEKIWDAVMMGGEGKGRGKEVKPHAATVLQPATSSTYLYDLDQITQSIVNSILQWQKSHEGEVGGEVVLLNDQGTVELPTMGRVVGLPQLQRMRRQFISLNRQHPLERERISGAFAEFLNEGWT